MPRVYPSIDLGSPPPPVQVPVSPARRIPSSHGTRRPPPRKHYETASLYSLKRAAHARLHRQAHSAPALHPSAVDPACVAVVRGLVCSVKKLLTFYKRQTKQSEASHEEVHRFGAVREGVARELGAGACGHGLEGLRRVTHTTTSWENELKRAHA